MALVGRDAADTDSIWRYRRQFTTRAYATQVASMLLIIAALIAAATVLATFTG